MIKDIYLFVNLNINFVTIDVFCYFENKSISMYYTFQSSFNQVRSHEHENEIFDKNRSKVRHCWNFVQFHFHFHGSCKLGLKGLY